MAAVHIFGLGGALRPVAMNLTISDLSVAMSGGSVEVPAAEASLSKWNSACDIAPAMNKMRSWSTCGSASGRVRDISRSDT